jgi:sporulation-control protein
MFKKLFASVGIGSAKVDAIIKTENIYPNTPVDIEIVIKGGKTEQDLKGLTLGLFTSAQEEMEINDNDIEMNNSVLLDSWLVELEDSVIQPNQEIRVECQIFIHPETPITEIESGRSEVWLKTGLDIDNGVDASDKDYLTILLPDLQRHVLTAVEELGYSLKKIDTESGRLRGDGFESSIDCYQEFEFRKSTGIFSAQEIELSFIDLDEEVGIVIEIDRSFSGDSYMSVVIPKDADYDGVYGWFEENLS